MRAVAALRCDTAAMQSATSALTPADRAVSLGRRYAMRVRRGLPAIRGYRREGPTRSVKPRIQSWRFLMSHLRNVHRKVCVIAALHLIAGAVMSGSAATSSAQETAR